MNKTDANAPKASRLLWVGLIVILAVGVGFGVRGGSPDARGEVLRMIAKDLTPGMEIVKSDARRSGELFLKGADQTMWVWHNRVGWTDKPGSEYTVGEVPAGSDEILVYSWDGLRQTVRIGGDTNVTIKGLSSEKTYMFVERKK